MSTPLLKTHTEDPSVEVFSNVSGVTPLRQHELCRWLFDITDGWPKRVAGSLSYLEKSELRILESEAALFAWLDRYVITQWTRKGVSKREFFEAVQQNAQRYEWATSIPHYPPLPGVLYLRDAPLPTATGKLDELVDRFSPASRVDRELLKAAFVTPAAGMTPGSRPIFVFTLDESTPDPRGGRGSGKTTVTNKIARLFGGAVPVRSTMDYGQLVSDLLSHSALSKRILLQDNLKSHRYSSEFIESLITSPTIGGHRLYHGHGSRPNYLTMLVTVNGASFSKDLAERSIVIYLKRPTITDRWEAETDQLIDTHRDDLFADIGYFLNGPRVSIVPPRWAEWWNTIGSRLHNPDEILKVTLARQGAIDEDDDSAVEVVGYIRCKLQQALSSDPDAQMVFIPSTLMNRWISESGARVDGRNASAFVKNLKSPLLQYQRMSQIRGFLWVGPAYTPTVPPQAVIQLNPTTGRP